MKKMTSISIILAFIVSSMVCGSYAAPKDDRDKVMRQRIQWVEKCLKDFESIKPGMTSSEIEKKFPMDGGLQSVSPVRFIHSSCPYFKIDVEFAFKRNPDDQNRAIWGKEDKSTKVSKPYIERPALD